MWALIKLIINPLNWAKLFSVLSAAWSLVKAALFYLRKREQQKYVEEIKKLEEQIREANSIPDDEQRLKKKAQVACELERRRNPNADCD